MKRNFFRSGIQELEQIVLERGLSANLDDIIHELSFRSTKRAKKLLESINQNNSSQNIHSKEKVEINKSLKDTKDNTNNNSDTQKFETTFKRSDFKQSSNENNYQNKKKNIDSSNKENSESKKDKENVNFKNSSSDFNQNSNFSNQTSFTSAENNTEDKTDLIEVDDVFANFINALEIEINEIKKKSQEQTIDLVDGILVESAHENHIYQFPYKESFNIKEDLPIILLIGGNEIGGTVVSFSNKKLKISIEENLGKRIGFAQLKMDNSFLLLRLKERLEEVTGTDNKEIFNISIAKKVIGEEKSKSGIDESLHNSNKLNENQFQSLKVASESEVMYLWGPPGTGKTFTLAKVIDLFYQKKKRILLVSNTNLAVDLLLKSLCKFLSLTKDEEFENSSVLRFGKISDEELDTEYGDYVNIDKAVIRLAQALNNEKLELENKLVSLNNEKSPYVKIKTSFERLEALDTIIKKNETKQNELNEFIKNIESKTKNLQKKIQELEKESQASESTGAVGRWFTGKRNKETIDGEILSKQNELNNLLAKKNSTPQELLEIKENLSKYFEEKKENELIIKGQDLEDIKKRLEVYEKQIGEIETRLNEIEKEISEIKDQVLKNARVIAATATQVFLKPASFDMFDVVIIDESSVLPLPLVSYVAGLAKEKVTVTGDFKQLPPIVSANKDSGVMKWIGSDVFNKSGIEKAVSSGEKPINLVQLKTQYRMNENICNLINKRFYSSTLITDPSTNKKDKEYPAFFNNNLMIVNTSKQIPFCNTKPRTNSKYNILHAIAIRNLIHFLKLQSFTDDIKDLGVISPYSAQADLISKLLDEYKVDNVECGTVHRFQGNEKNVIFYDLVDSYGIPWLGRDDQKLINVALSRAKYHLVIFANLEFLNAKLPNDSIMRGVLSEIQSKGSVIDAKEVIELGPNSFDVEVEGFKSEDIDFEKSGTRFFDQTNFDDAVIQDIRNAKKWIVIFSGFSTPKRIAFWADIFRQKISEGVKIRCVTRSPNNQGNIDPETAREAINQLVKMGVVVDLRHEIHEKTIFIDEEIFWYGSLNPLSHTGKTEESMLRIPSKQISLLKARYEIYKKGFKNEDSPFDIITERENPSCPECENLIIFHHRGPYGAYYNCSNCEWKQSVDRYNQKDYAKKSTIEEPIINFEKKTCSKCGKDMKLRRSRFGSFYGCSGYPQCKNTEKIKKTN